MAADELFGPPGDASRHRALGALETGLAALPVAPRDAGRVALVVRRGPDKIREAPGRVDLRPGGGIPGDAWVRHVEPDPEAALTVMEMAVAELIANGQPLTVFGDNLFLVL